MACSAASTNDLNLHRFETSLSGDKKKAAGREIVVGSL